MRVYKTDPGIMDFPAAALASLAEAGITLDHRPSPTEDELIRNCADANGLIVVGEPITRRVIESLPDLKVIGRCGVGVDVVDLEAATEHGVQVCNVPDANFHEVASHAMALALGLLRNLRGFDRGLRAGRWTGGAGSLPQRRESSLVLGLVGFGQIGRRVAELARPFGFRILAFDPYMDATQISDGGAEPATLDEILEASHVVSLHLPLTAETYHLIDEHRLARMRPDAYLLNVSRGGLIDEAALVSALDRGVLAGAGIDVFETEPVPADHPLVGQENVILTPHVAYRSADSLVEVAEKVAADVVTVLHGRHPQYPVNVLDHPPTTLAGTSVSAPLKEA